MRASAALFAAPLAILQLSALAVAPAARADATQASQAAAITLLDAAGLQAELQSVQGSGDTVVLLNFWATWCRPCLDEIPIFRELERKYGAQGFRLVAVSLDDPESLGTHIEPFMQKWFPEFRSYLSVEYDMDDMVSVVDQGWNEVLPTSYLFARDGSLSERLQGKFTAEEFEARVSALLAP